METTAPKQNNRLITQKGRTFEDWWNPIDQWLSGRSPILKRYGLVGIAAHLPFEIFGDQIKVARDDSFMVVVRHAEDGELRLSAFVLKAEMLGAGLHIFDATLDTRDERVAWRLAHLLSSVFNAEILDPDHQSDLERLLFSA